jgi:hypothetical protein
LGAFFLASTKRHHAADGILVAMWSTILIMIWFIGPAVFVQIILLTIVALCGMWIFIVIQSRYRFFQLGMAISAVALFLLLASPQIAWPWYVPIGTGLMYLLGMLMGGTSK